jgi:hypothetical protein
MKHHSSYTAALKSVKDSAGRGGKLFLFEAADSTALHSSALGRRFLFPPILRRDLPFRLGPDDIEWIDDAT